MPASRRCVPVLLRLALLAALLAAAPAQGLRCDGRLVGTGDHAVQVERRCGEPYWIERYSECLVVGENQALERRIERQLDAWYYHFGPDRLLHRLLFIDGRDDEMIISCGENIFPGEVEDLITGHELVIESAVIGVKDDEFGQTLKAFVVLTAGAELDEGDVKAHVKANLASYKAPKEVVFLDALPRNATGKVLKRSLA